MVVECAIRLYLDEIECSFRRVRGFIYAVLLRRFSLIILFPRCQKHFTYRLPKNPKSTDHWYSTFSVDIKTGLDHCAARSIAFHYIKGNLMKRLHAILYGHCA